MNTISCVIVVEGDPRFELGLNPGLPDLCEHSNHNINGPIKGTIKYVNI